ncbi:hypothetical protein CORC01_04015 [Colletotrichum orchidophilum]|uniref:Zn(2)-C6 fungal-type domain-containing protein n=1 Tax=Colletotrichum orchidophilum TaxID=1209926 RepID=A0A1G4BHB8_9PEZI|nr:uncharacterized protein CORC01_04015 [Colletotrichum orchidophilum]OHF00698.1 hypothetical protein CORC01_04015 [Colletotrichum orchidophilum]
MSTKPRRTLAGPIFRVRTGCLTCRGRKKKCDETKPRCRGCERNRLECRWPPTSSSQAASSQASQSGGTSRSPRETANSPETARQDDGQPVSHSIASPSGSTAAPPSPQHLPDRSLSFSFASQPASSESPSAATTDSSPSPATQLITTDPSGIIVTSQIPEENTAASIGLQDSSIFAVFNPDDPDDDESTGQMVSSPLQPTSIFRDHHVPRSMNLLAGHQDSNSLELLSHYLSSTSLSMANGSTADNPFTAQLIPLAFSSDLVLQLLLTQSAVHRAAKSLVPTDQIATKYYNQSLRLFQQNISTYMGGQHGEETLILGIGALILCLVETAKGDVNGTIFDHLMAAQSLILPFLSANNTFLHKTLKDFLTEYYIYTATVSMISIDARLGDQLFLSNDLILLATELVASSYIGSLCGCWLDLILLVPSIFDLGRRIMSHMDEPNWRPSADDFILFSQLQSQILNWQPNPTVTENVALAGYIYQKALLLYLHTALHTLSREEHGLQAMAIQNALGGALSHLAQLDPSVRINTSLCWPITIIGSCVTDTGQQEFLHERLGHMFATIGLGNIRQTSVVLQHLWDHNEATPADIGAGPWQICRVMNENQIWISFA